MARLVTESIAGLRPYQGGKPIEELARERGLSRIVKLASNESPLGPSPRVLEAISRALGEVHRYPDGAAFRLRSSLAASLGVGFDEVVHGNGSNELLELVVRVFLVPGDHMVFGRPAFAMYPVIAQTHGALFTAVPTSSELVHDLEGMLAALRPSTRLVIIDNPNNPTGTYVPRAAVEDFLRRVPEEVIVVLDEAYFEYADRPDYPDGLELRGLRERLIVLRTFSKAYGLAGLRVGYGVGPAELMGYVNRIRPPFNVGVLGQEAAIVALGEREHLTHVVAHNSRERARLDARLAAYGRVFPSQANFILVDFGRPSAPLYEALLGQGVIVRPIPGLETHLRISLGTEEENDFLLAALGKVCG
jgi:histidinol-phosphate aminotransferase